VALGLYVKIKGKYKLLSAVAVGPGLTPIRKVSINRASQQYIKLCTSQKCQNNQKTEIIYFKKFCDFMIRRNVRSMDEITLQHLEEFVQHLSEKMKPVSVNRRMSAIKNFLSKCHEWGLIRIRFHIKKKRQKPNPHRVWPEEIFKKFLRRTDESHHNFFMFLWLTGCRPIEAANFQWTDICYEKGFLTLTCGKNSNLSRQFPITPKLSALLHNIKPRSSFVFTKKNGKAMVTGCLYVYVKDRLQYITKEKFTMYGIRHTFGFRLNKGGANAFTIASLMGHSDLKTTRNYMHTDEIDLVALLSKL
jgi:integrase